MSSCKNKNLEICYKQVDTYEQGKIGCLSETDKVKRDACVSRNEVSKISRKDCEDINK